MPSNTHQILLNWDKGQPFAERMSAKLLYLEGYKDIDPQHPTGGPDGKKDIICFKGTHKYIVACYFASKQKSFSEIKRKFNSDITGVQNNLANGFIFITNQKVSISEKKQLIKGYKFSIEIYDNERILNLLDSPSGYGIRLEYLDIELSKEEQISFINEYNNNIIEQLKELKKTTNSILNNVQKEIPVNRALLPISGMNLSSRISIEDIFVIHKAILEQTQTEGFYYKFRNIDVWIGNNIEEKKYIPPSYQNVPTLMYELLNWWREEYMKVIYASEEQKITAIAIFHAKFLSIHPFVDGNGRTARTITSIQCNDMLNKNIHFQKMDKKTYYNALELCDKTLYTELNNLFRAFIK